MKYNTLLFDIDNTLLDFDADEAQALSRLFKIVGVDLTPDIRHQYSTFNQSLWKKLELGEITRSELLSTRFITFFKENFALNVEPLNLNTQYIEFLSDGHDLIDHADQLLNKLEQNNQIRLEIATNGAPETQYKRLREAEIIDYFEQIFISEEIGAHKPDREYFEYIGNHLPDFNPSKALIIGDSLTSDIQGGMNAKIDTVWFNPDHKSINSSVTPTYEIDDLLQITDLI